MTSVDSCSGDSRLACLVDSKPSLDHAALRWQPLVLRMGLAALVVFIGSYLGALAGTAVVFPGLGAAVLFPPYAVLAAALILAPIRHWWLYILASVAGNFWPHLRHEGLTSFVLLAEVANVSRGVVAALGLRWFGERVDYFDTFRGTVVFLASAVVVAPVIGAFIGAANVTMHNPTAAFWKVWQAWLLSNVLVGLTLLPLILIVCVRRRDLLRRASVLRLIEGLILSVGVLGVAVFVFTVHHDIALASLFLPLPLLLWAAVRFGPGGLIAALSAVAATAITGAISGRGPFITQSPAENFIELQYFLIAVCVPLLLLAAIVRQQTRTAEALRQSQARYRAVVDDQTDLICRFLPDTTLTFVNDAYCRFFARKRGELLGRKFIELIPPAAQQSALHHIEAVIANRRDHIIEHEVSLPDGTVGWQQWIDRVIAGTDGYAVELQGVGRDVTDRRRAEEALRKSLQQIQDLARRLISTQEMERTRIASELHDDMSQRLAAISLGLSAMKRTLGVDAQGEVARLQLGLVDIAGEIRTLSHTLHPGVLHHVGLVPALRAHCLEFQRNYDIAAKVTGDQDIAVSADAALCLYRVAQEGLQNVARHSEATKVEIQIRRDDKFVYMNVSDDGRGFDEQAATAAQGLGIISLEERVHLLHGSLSIRALPGRGTILSVQIPSREVPHAASASTAG